MTRLWLACAVAALACGSMGCSGRTADFERMRRQQRTDPYEASTVFADGRTMRVPPAGAVQHDARDVPSGVATGFERGGAVQDVPVPVTPALLEHGQHEFDIFCTVCHGRSGSGDSVMSGNLRRQRLPALSTYVAGHSAGDLFALISRSGDDIHAFDWALSPPDRWSVVAYVQTLPRTAAGGAGS